jgi:hypothetical protein
VLKSTHLQGLILRHRGNFHFIWFSSVQKHVRKLTPLWVHQTLLLWPLEDKMVNSHLNFQKRKLTRLLMVNIMDCHDNFLGKGFSWKLYNFSADNKLPTLWILKRYYHVHKSPLLDHIMSKFNSISLRSILILSSHLYLDLLIVHNTNSKLQEWSSVAFDDVMKGRICVTNSSISWIYSYSEYDVGQWGG